MGKIDVQTWLSSGIFGLRVISTSKTYLCGSNCMLDALNRHLKQIKLRHSSVPELNVQLDELEIVVLELKNDKILLQKHIDALGDLCLNKKNVIRYSIHIEFIDNKIGVFLRSSNRSKILVGVFKKMKEVNSFVHLHYKDGVKNIIYSNNLLTRAFRKGETDA